MFKKRLGQKLYQKAPNEVLVAEAKRLKRLALLSFACAILFLVASNPFFAVAGLKNVLLAIPEFIKVLPGESEKTTFAFFDWTEEQLNNSWPIFAKENTLADKEAGQSAVAPTNSDVDYEKIPFFIEIPRLKVYEKVHANVNPNDAKEYKTALEEGVAHAFGSAFPGQNKMIYIFGHSTDGAWNVEAFNAVFYQIKELQVGDQIILHFGEQKFFYEVQAQNIVSSEEVDFVNNLKDQPILLLQTCWPPGTSWQRLFVTAVPVTP